MDPTGDYRAGFAEKLELPDNSFDLVVSYLSLVDIEDLDTALSCYMPGLLDLGSTLSTSAGQSLWALLTPRRIATAAPRTS